MAKFEDVLIIKNGKNQCKVENPNGKYPIYGSGGVMGYADEYICEKDTVIIGRKGNINKPIYVEEPFWNVDTAFGLVANEDVILPKYLYHFCRQFNFEVLNTTVTIPSLTKANLLKVEIPLQPLDKQRKIVSVLDKASRIINLRKEQILKLDDMVKSQFIEMFGDPAFNKKGWEEVELSTLLRTKPSNGFFAKNNEYCEEGNAQVMWLSDVINRMYSNTENLKRVNATDKDLDKYRVQYGDLLFCRSSLNKEGIGKATAVPPYVDDVTMFECHVIRTPLDLDRCVPEFMQIQTTLDYFRNQVLSNSKTATMTTIGQDGIVSTKVIVPPLHLQKEFTTFIEKTNKLKFEMEQSLVELENNFNSLMQRAFKGELF